MALAAIVRPAGRALAAAAGASGDAATFPLWAVVILWLITVWSLVWLTADLAKRMG